MELFEPLCQWQAAWTRGSDSPGGRLTRVGKSRADGLDGDVRVDAGSSPARLPISYLALVENGRHRTGVQQPVREGVANPGGHAKKRKGLRDFLRGQGGRYRGRRAFGPRHRATDLITKFAFATTCFGTPRDWTPNCTVPLRETRSTVGPVEYRQVARLCGFEPRTPDHLMPETAQGRVYPSRLRRVQKGVLRYRSAARKRPLKPR